MTKDFFFFFFSLKLAWKFACTQDKGRKGPPFHSFIYILMLHYKGVPSIVGSRDEEVGFFGAVGLR